MTSEDRPRFQRGGGGITIEGSNIRIRTGTRSAASYSQTPNASPRETPWERELRNLAWTALPLVATHPFSYAQIGFEPIAPYLGKDLFGRPTVYLGSVLNYFSTIYQQDGILGLFRGIGPSLAMMVASLYAQKYAEKAVTSLWKKWKPSAPVVPRFQYLLEKDPVGSLLESTLLQPAVPAIPRSSSTEARNTMALETFVEDLTKEVVILSATTAITWPLQVIVLRSMAQFIGKEQLYRYLLGSFREIFFTEGVCGFFKGLVPALVHVVIVTVSSNLIVYLFALSTPQGAFGLNWFRLVAGSIVSGVFYPIKLTSRLAAIGGARLIAARSPYIPTHTSSLSIYFALLRIGQTKRGNAFFFRQPTSTFEKPSVEKKSPVKGRPTRFSEQSMHSTISSNLHFRPISYFL